MAEVAVGYVRVPPAASNWQSDLALDPLVVVPARGHARPSGMQVESQRQWWALVVTAEHLEQ